jgi:hypothetical protein
MAQSTRYVIHQQMFVLAQAVAAANTAEALNNPSLPAGLQGKTRVIFMLDRGDQLLEQPSQSEKRRVRLVMGAFVRSTTADQAVDELHFAARIAMRAAWAALKAAQVEALLFKEVQVEPELKETQTDGALLLSAFEIDYREKYPVA